MQVITCSTALDRMRHQIASFARPLLEGGKPSTFCLLVHRDCDCLSIYQSPPPLTSFLNKMATHGGLKIAPSNGPDALSHRIAQLRSSTNRRSKATSRDPTPITPPLPSPPDLSTHQYTRPVRRILSPKDHELFLSSPTYKLVLAFTFGLSDSVRGLAINDLKGPQSDAISNIAKIVSQIRVLVQNCPQKIKVDHVSEIPHSAFCSIKSRPRVRHGIDKSLASRTTRPLKRHLLI